MSDDPSRREHKEVRAPADNLGRKAESEWVAKKLWRRAALKEPLVKNLLRLSKRGSLPETAAFVVFFYNWFPIDERGTEATSAARKKRIVPRRYLTPSRLSKFLDGRTADACVIIDKKSIIISVYGNVPAQPGQRLSLMLQLLKTARQSRL